MYVLYITKSQNTVKSIKKHASFCQKDYLMTLTSNPGDEFNL